MNTSNFILATASVLSLGLALQATSSTTTSQDTDNKKPARTGSVVKVLTTADDTQDVDVKKHTLSVTNNNGDVTVIVDGKELPAGQIEVGEDGIIVIDEDGNVLKTIDMKFDWANKHFGQWNEIATFIEDDWSELKGGIALDGENLIFGELAPGDMQFGWAFEGDHPDVMLGVFLDEPGEALRKHLRIEGDATIISEIMEGLPADVAGLEQYDVIVSVDGLEPAGPDVIHKVLAEKQPGDTITLRVIQRGDKKTVDVTLSEYDAEKMMGFRAVQDFTGKARAGNRWFVSPPEFEFENLGGNVVLPENLQGNIQVFVHPEGIHEVLELPDFEVDVDAEAMHEAIQNALERSRVNLELREEALQQFKDAQSGELRKIMPRIRVKQLHDADEHVKKAIELQLQDLNLHEMNSQGDMKRLHDHLLKQLPKVEIQRSLEDVRKAHEQAAERMPEIKMHLDEARQMHEHLRKAAPDLEGQIDAVKQRLDHLEELLQRLLEDLDRASV